LLKNIFSRFIFIFRGGSSAGPSGAMSTHDDLMLTAIAMEERAMRNSRPPVADQSVKVLAVNETGYRPT